MLNNTTLSHQEVGITCTLCQTLLLKKGVSPDRFLTPEMEQHPVQCPDHCHECCRSSVILDLTSMEALMVFLLNREVVELVMDYVDLQGETEYCPFMMQDKCIIHAYKPTACQMFMPFEYKGRPLCHYIKNDENQDRENVFFNNYLNSYAYDIHGFMLLMQQETSRFPGPSFFKNVFQGVQWWKRNYGILPETTRNCLESILIDEPVNELFTADFSLSVALDAGHRAYTSLLKKHSACILS